VHPIEGCTPSDGIAEGLNCQPASQAKLVTTTEASPATSGVSQGPVDICTYLKQHWLILLKWRTTNRRFLEISWHAVLQTTYGTVYAGLY